MKRVVRPALSMILLAAIFMIGLVLYRLGPDKAETLAAIISAS